MLPPGRSCTPGELSAWPLVNQGRSKAGRGWAGQGGGSADGHGWVCVNQSPVQRNRRGSLGILWGSNSPPQALPRPFPAAAVSQTEPHDQPSLQPSLLPLQRYTLSSPYINISPFFHFPFFQYLQNQTYAQQAPISCPVPPLHPPQAPPRCSCRWSRWAPRHTCWRGRGGGRGAKNCETRQRNVRRGVQVSSSHACRSLTPSHSLTSLSLYTVLPPSSLPYPPMMALKSRPLAELTGGGGDETRRAAEES